MFISIVTKEQDYKQFVLKRTMQLTKIFSVIFLLITSLCLAQGIIKISELDDEMDNQLTLVDAVVSSNKNKRIAMFNG